MNSKLIVLVSPDKDTLHEACARLHELSHDGFIKLHNMAVIEQDSAGHARVHQTADVDMPHGIAFGTFVGILIGLLSGPPGIGVTLVAGGITGGLAARGINLGLQHRDLQPLEQALPVGSGAVVLQVAAEFAERVPDVVAGLPVQIISDETLTGIVAQLRAHDQAPTADTALHIAERTSRAGRATLYETLLESLDHDLRELQTLIGHSRGTIQESLLVRVQTLHIRRAVWWRELQQALDSQLAIYTAQIDQLESDPAPVVAERDAEIARVIALRDAARTRLLTGQAAQRAAEEAEKAVL